MSCIFWEGVTHNEINLLLVCNRQVSCPERDGKFFGSDALRTSSFLKGHPCAFQLFLCRDEKGSSCSCEVLLSECRWNKKVVFHMKMGTVFPSCSMKAQNPDMPIPSVCVWIPWLISLCFPDVHWKLHQMRSYDHVKYLSLPERL